LNDYEDINNGAMRIQKESSRRRRSFQEKQQQQQAVGVKPTLERQTDGGREGEGENGKRTRRD
jgi:hypothetical protein